MVEEIEQGIGNSEGAAELSAAALESDALLAYFLEANRDVGGVADVVELDVNVLFENGLEVPGASKSGKADFQGVLIERVAFAERNATPNEAIVEFVQPLKLEAVDQIGRRIAEVELDADGMSVGVEDRACFYRLEGRGVRFRIARSQAGSIDAAKPIDVFEGERAPLLGNGKGEWLPALRFYGLLKGAAGIDGFETIEGTPIDRNSK